MPKLTTIFAVLVLSYMVVGEAVNDYSQQNGGMIQIYRFLNNIKRFLFIPYFKRECWPYNK